MNRFYTTNRNPVTVLLCIIVFAGIYCYTRIQTSLFPEITFPKIKIIADAGLQPVDRMMLTVTKPLEEAIKQIPNLETIRSTTSRGTCEISAMMNWGTDMDLAQLLIESRIAEVRNNLPPDVNITVAKMNPSILPVMGYSLESNSRSPIELKQLATYTIKPFLSAVPGVSEIPVTGGNRKEYWVQMNIQKMSTLGISPDMIDQALSQANFIKSNGFVKDYRYLYLSLTDASIESKGALEEMVIRNDQKRITRLKDIATVELKGAIEYIKVSANGKEGVLIAVIKQPSANLIELSNNMKAKVEALKQILPKDVVFKPYYMQADFVSDSVKSVIDSLLIGLGLAIIVAIFFLRSVKATATILITVPLTLLLTVVVLYECGYTLNIMTLGAIAAALGLIIDDAIVVVEQIHRTHEDSPGAPSIQLVQKAIAYLFPAMVGSSMTTIIVFLPFLLLTGVAGSYFHVMTNTMIITLACSFFVTWVGLPVVYLLLSRPRKEANQPDKPVKHKSQRWVTFFIRRPLLSIAFIAGLILMIVLLVPGLQKGFLPEMDEGSIVLDYVTPPGTSLDETDRILKETEKIIQATPDVVAYSRRTGTQMGFFITEPNSGDFLIQLNKSRKRTTNAVIEELREKIEGSQPALRVDFGQVIGDMLGDLTTSVQPVEIKIFGADNVVLQDLSRKATSIIEPVRGIADPFDGIVIAGPSIAVKPNYSILAQYGMTAANLQYQLQSAIEGNVLGNIFEKDQNAPIRLKYPLTGGSISTLDKIQVFLPDGRLKPISELASVNINSGEAEIQRENLQSMGVVTSDLEGRDLGSTMKEVQQEINSKLQLPNGYHLEYGGSYSQQQQSFKELLLILIAAGLLVFCVIMFLFRKVNVALTILAIGMLGIPGSLLGLWLTNTPLNVGSYTGLIMIVGIIAENSIFTYLQFNRSLEEMSVDEALVFAISTRLRPKLMTALGAIIALLPLALGIGTGAQLHQPLAIAVIGGFVVAIPLLLIVLPSMLRLLFKNVSPPGGKQRIAIVKPDPDSDSKNMN